MAAGDLTFNGWSVTSLLPTAERIAKVRAGIGRPTVDPALGSRQIKAAGADGSVPATKNQNQPAVGNTTGEDTPDGYRQRLQDAILGSRDASTVQPDVKKIVASGSVYQSPEIQSYLSGSVDALNETAQAQLASRDAIMQRVLQEAIGGNPLAWEAVRAGLVSPDARVTFGSSVQPAVIRGGGGGSAAPYVAPTLSGYQAAADKRVADAEAAWGAKFPSNTYAGSAWMPAPATNAYPRVI